MNDGQDFADIKKLDGKQRQEANVINIMIAKRLNVDTDFDKNAWPFLKFGKKVLFYPTKNSWRYANGKKYVRWYGDFEGFWDWMNS